MKTKNQNFPSGKNGYRKIKNAPHRRSQYQNALSESFSAKILDFVSLQWRNLSTGTKWGVVILTPLSAFGAYKFWSNSMQQKHEHKQSEETQKALLEHLAAREKHYDDLETKQHEFVEKTLTEALRTQLEITKYHQHSIIDKDIRARQLRAGDVADTTQGPNHQVSEEDSHDSFKTYDDFSNVRTKDYLQGTPFPEGDLIFLHGKRGSSKSWLMMQALWNLSMGKPARLFNTLPTSSRPLVLLYDSELGEAKCKERYSDLEMPDNFRFKFNEQFKNVDDFLEQVEKDIREQSAIVQKEHVIVAFDVLASSFKKALHYTHMQELVIRLKHLIQKFEAEGITLTIICVGHTKEKGEDMRVPEQVPDHCDMVIGFFPDEKNPSDRVLKITKSNGTNLKGYTIALKRVRNMKGKSFLFDVDRTAELNPDDEEDVDRTAGEDHDEEDAGANAESTLPNPFTPGSKLSKVPTKVAFAMANWYQNGVDGHGKTATLNKFKAESGLSDKNEVIKIVEAVYAQKYGPYVPQTPTEDTDN